MPIAITEDTAGSTRSPAAFNGNFGYDPTRGRYPNAGNPGISLICDQIGFNARSMQDAIEFDRRLMGIDAAPSRDAKTLRVGLPRWPFLESYVPEGGHNPFEYAQFPRAYLPSDAYQIKYDAAVAALDKAGVQLVREEWPSEGGVNVLMDALYLTNYNGRPLSHHADYAATYAGQVARWVHEFLNATGVSIQDIITDTLAARACVEIKQ